ncbi:MAG: hypothetical protein V1912_00895 [bacterium]
MRGRKRPPLLGVALLVVIAASLVAFGCGTAASAGVPLQYTRNAGDSWAYEMTMVMNGSVEGPGVTEAGGDSLLKDTTIKMRVGATVKEVTDGVATVAFKYELLEAAADGKPIDPGTQTAQEITVKVDQTGRVVSVEGADQSGLASGLIDSGLPFDPTEFTNQFSVPFPEDGLGKVGDEWSATSTYPLPGTGQDITASTKAKLIAVTTENGRQVATIDYSVAVPMDLTLDLGAMLQQIAKGMGAGDAGDVAFKMTMEGGVDFRGTAKVDTADGRATSTDGIATLKIEMAITEAPENMVPQDQRGPFTIDMTLAITMVEVD